MTDFSNRACMLCSSMEMRFVSELRDDDTCFAMECCSCGHVQISPLPSVKEEVAFYQQNEMSRRLISKDILDDEMIMMKHEAWGNDQCRVALENIVHPDNSILEIGSGYGWFVEKMRKRGYFVDGIELSDEKRQMAYNRAGIELSSVNLLEDVLPSKMQEAYDMVCMFHVLEHILDPQIFIQRILSALKSNGKILVVVPNYFSELRQISKAYDKFSFFRAHISYFKPETLAMLMKKAGLVDVQVEGTQLYSLENAMNWVRTGVPCLEQCQIDMPQGLEWIGELYKRTLEKKMISDGLIAIGTKQ